jgi:hypothetical protein
LVQATVNRYRIVLPHLGRWTTCQHALLPAYYAHRCFCAHRTRTHTTHETMGPMTTNGHMRVRCAHSTPHTHTHTHNTSPLTTRRRTGLAVQRQQILTDGLVAGAAERRRLAAFFAKAWRRRVSVRDQCSMRYSADELGSGAHRDRRGSPTRHGCGTAAVCTAVIAAVALWVACAPDGSVR